jgi:hypothetical protein
MVLEVKVNICTNNYHHQNKLSEKWFKPAQNKPQSPYKTSTLLSLCKAIQWPEIFKPILAL